MNRYRPVFHITCESPKVQINLNQRGSVLNISLSIFSFPKPLLALTTMSRSSEKETDKDRLPHSPSSERNVGTNTEVAGTEPYYSVPVLQNVLSEGGVTSRLYSVQVMTQSELDYHRQHSSHNQVSGK